MTPFHTHSNRTSNACVTYKMILMPVFFVAVVAASTEDVQLFTSSIYVHFRISDLLPKCSITFFLIFHFRNPSKLSQSKMPLKNVNWNFCDGASLKPKPGVQPFIFGIVFVVKTRISILSQCWIIHVTGHRGWIVSGHFVHGFGEYGIHLFVAIATKHNAFICSYEYHSMSL